MVRIAAMIPCLDNKIDKEEDRNKYTNNSCFPIMNNDKDTRIALVREQVRNIFMKHDTDKDGKLTWDELIAAFNSLGSRWSHYRAWRALSHADINKDNCINVDGPEFNALIDYVLNRCAYKFG